MRGWHFIEHDLNLLDENVQDLAADGLKDIEALLGKHAAFEAFCDERDRRP